jgi:hypothetical protein
LWPAVLGQVRTKSVSEAQIVTTCPHLGAVPGQLTSRIDGAVDCIDVLVCAALFLVDGHPDLAAILARKSQTAHAPARGTNAGRARVLT